MPFRIGEHILIEGMPKGNEAKDLRSNIAVSDAVWRIGAKACTISQADQQNCLTRKVFESTPYGNKTRGRPRTKRISNIEGDLGRIGMRNWKTRAQDRMKWRLVEPMNKKKSILRSI